MEIHFFYCCSIAQSCLTLCSPMDCSMPGSPVLHHLQESDQTHVHLVGDTFQSSHLLSSPSPPAFNLSQHQGLSKWVIPEFPVSGDKVVLLLPVAGSVLFMWEIYFPLSEGQRGESKHPSCTDCLLSNFIQTKRVITLLRHILGRPTLAHSASVPFIICPLQTFYIHTPILAIYPSDLEKVLLTVININACFLYTSDRFLCDYL